MKYKLLILLSILTLSTLANSNTLSNEQLLAFFEVAEKAQLDNSNSVEIDNLLLEHQDIKLNLVDGKLSFFRPVLMDTVNFTYAAFFEGTGSLKFTPAISMEKEQLKRYTKSEILDKPINKVILLFSSDYYQQYFKDLVLTSMETGESDSKLSESMMRALTSESQNLYMFELLRSIQNPIGKPFLR
jgi:hypothetical protein